MKNKSFRRIIDISKPHIKSIVLLSLLAIIIEIIEITKPYLIKIIIDDYLKVGITSKAFISINIIAFSYILLVIVGNILDFLSRVFTSKMGEEVLFEIRTKIYKYSQYANISFHDKTPAGKLFSRIINDVDDISAFFKDVITTFFKDIISIIAIILIMIYFSFKLSLLSFIVLPFVILTSILFTYLLNNLYTKAKMVRTKLTTFLAESIYGTKLIKIFNIENVKEKEYKKLTKEYLDVRKPSSIYEGIFPSAIALFENIAFSIIVFASINNFWGIDVEIGLIYVYVSYIKSLFEPITRIIDNIEIVQEAIVSINKIYDIIDNTSSLEDFSSGKSIKNIKGKLEFKNVWFAYEKDNWVLKNISFIIEPGETIALVGKTGSGKTTITNLVNRFYDIQKGEILLDGVNIKELNLKELRQRVGTVLQDPFIFARSIKENVKLNKKISNIEIRKAIELASADEFVNNLPNGINNIAKERGESYSAGEKQLIAFARIFAHNPDIFILDEATANIDTYTESLIQKSIEVLSKQKTAIFIAHRLATIVNVDKILVLNNGEIIEDGSHKDLLKKNGYYAKLYNSYYESLS